MDKHTGSVDHFVATLEDWQSLAISKLRKIITSAVIDMKETIRDSAPLYEHQGPCCGIKLFKNHVSFEFWRGKELSDKYSILSGNGKQKRHIKITSTEDIQETLFSDIVRSAANLNKALGDPRNNKNFTI